MLGLFHEAAADTSSYVRDDRWVVLGTGTVGSAVPEGAAAAADTFSYAVDAHRVVLGNGKTGQRRTGGGGGRTAASVSSTGSAVVVCGNVSNQHRRADDYWPGIEICAACGLTI